MVGAKKKTKKGGGTKVKKARRTKKWGFKKIEQGEKCHERCKIMFNISQISKLILISLSIRDFVNCFFFPKYD